MYTIHHDCVRWPLLPFHNLFPLLLALHCPSLNTLIQFVTVAVWQLEQLPTFCCFCSVYFIFWDELLYWPGAHQVSKLRWRGNSRICPSLPVLYRVRLQVCIMRPSTFHMGSGNWTQVLCFNTTTLLTHLFPPFFKVLSYSYNSFVLLFPSQINECKV